MSLTFNYELRIWDYEFVMSDLSYNVLLWDTSSDSMHERLVAELLESGLSNIIRNS